jgi:hypothetical protein
MVKALDTRLSTSDFFVACSSLLICARRKAGHNAPQEEACGKSRRAGPTARRGAHCPVFNRSMNSQQRELYVNNGKSDRVAGRTNH